MTDVEKIASERASGRSRTFSAQNNEANREAPSWSNRHAPYRMRHLI
ncbi:MAG: hypothetical protein AB7F41_10040 [Methylocystis sp.]